MIFACAAETLRRQRYRARQGATLGTPARWPTGRDVASVAWLRGALGVWRPPQSAAHAPRARRGKRDPAMKSILRYSALSRSLPPCWLSPLGHGIGIRTRTMAGISPGTIFGINLGTTSRMSPGTMCGIRPGIISGLSLSTMCWYQAQRRVGYQPRPQVWYHSRANVRYLRCAMVGTSPSAIPYLPRRHVSASPPA